MTQAAAAANGQQTSARPNTGTSKSAKATSLTLAQKLALKMQGGAQVPQRDPLLRDSPLARPLLGKRAHALRTGEAPSRKGREGDPLLPTAHPCSRRATPGSSPRARSAQGRDLRGVRPVLPIRRSQSRGASRVTRRRPGTGSTSACSRWARTRARSPATETRRTSRLVPPTGSSSCRAATGARGAVAGPRPDGRDFRRKVRGR